MGIIIAALGLGMLGGVLGGGLGWVAGLATYPLFRSPTPDCMAEGLHVIGWALLGVVTGAILGMTGGAGLACKSMGDRKPQEQRSSQGNQLPAAAVVPAPKPEGSGEEVSPTMQIP